MNKKAFAILVATMFISMLGFGIVVPLLPIYADQLGATALEIGFINAGFSLSLMVFLPFMGRLSDRFGRKVFLCTGLAILYHCLAWLHLGTDPSTANICTHFPGHRGLNALAYCSSLPRRYHAGG